MKSAEGTNRRATDLGKMVRLIQGAVGGCATHWAQVIASHLLENGVSFVTDNNVGDNWISVKERMPDNVEDVLVYSKGRIGIGCYFQSTKLWANDSFHSWDITHWMPLPEPPKEDSDVCKTV